MRRGVHSLTPGISWADVRSWYPVPLLLLSHSAIWLTCPRTHGNNTESLGHGKRDVGTTVECPWQPSAQPVGDATREDVCRAQELFTATPSFRAGLGGEEASETRPSTRGAFSRRQRPTDNRPAVLLPEAFPPLPERNSSCSSTPLPSLPTGHWLPLGAGHTSSLPAPLPVRGLPLLAVDNRQMRRGSLIAASSAFSLRGPSSFLLKLAPKQPPHKMHRGQGRPASGGTAGEMQGRVVIAAFWLSRRSLLASPAPGTSTSLTTSFDNFCAKLRNLFPPFVPQRWAVAPRSQTSMRTLEKNVG